MSRSIKFALLTMAAFLVLGFSITATAAKYKPQVIRSAAIAGYYHICHATNFAEREIYVTWKIFRETGYEQADKVEWVAPGETIAEMLSGKKSGPRWCRKSPPATIMRHRILGPV